MRATVDAVSVTEVEDVLEAYVKRQIETHGVNYGYAAATGGLKAILTQALLVNKDAEDVRKILAWAGRN
jgi:ABC-type polysaccharide transport system permease subunit